MKAKWMLTLMIATASATGVASAGDTQADGSAGTMEPGEANKDRATMHVTPTDMEHLDKNEDQMISSYEAASNTELVRRFEKLDQNGDGMLDQGEFAQFEGGPGWPEEKETEGAGSSDY